jgi:ATP-dependent Clp protease ATP-binding subunit ClpC
MARLSKCVYLAWELGSAEAGQLKQEYFTEDELLIGICSIEKIVFLIEEEQVNYNEDYVEIINAENDEIKEFFKEFKIETSSIRRGIRKLKGEGNAESEGQAPRSDSCKAIFDDATSIAESAKSDEVRCIHFLKAIINKPSDIIKTFFEDNGVEFEEMKTKLDIKTPPKKLKLASNSVLSNYGTNLTEMAKEGKLTPVLGRDEELLQVIRTLNKRKKNNPLIIGEPGVGKTALVNGLAIKIADGSIKNLKDKQIIEINMASLVAGTKYRGEFEEKITKLVNETKDNPEVILFVDEIHTILGAGSGSGSLDASNIIKPALANGDLVMIGATTLQEYRKYFETDPAFERRFQPVVLDEPSPEDTLFILKGLKPNYEEYHNVKISDEAIEAAVNLSVRYIPDRNLPDKALDVIDEACSRKLIPKLDVTNSLKIESIVSEEDVRTVVSEWTGVPIADESSQFEKAQKIEEYLKSKIIGQDHAIKKVSRRIKNSYAGINNPDKPLAVFLFLGPTGVGKTYFSKTLANFLFGSEKSLIRVDMSEYKEEHSISKLIGSPPGYKGNDEGGFLTNAIKNNPYSIVLLDEIEKGHPKVFDVFLQAFDEGRLTDGKGNTVNAKNCIFIMTSNMQLETKQDYNVAFGGTQEDMNTLNILDNLAQVMRPELVNRIDDVIIFNSLTKSDHEALVKMYVDDLAKRMSKERSIELKVKKSVYKYLVKKGYNANFGARYLKRTVEKILEYPISDMIVNGEVKQGDTLVVSIEQNDLEFKVE